MERVKFVYKVMVALKGLHLVFDGMKCIGAVYKTVLKVCCITRICLLRKMAYHPTFNVDNATHAPLFIRNAFSFVGNFSILCALDFAVG